MSARQISTLAVRILALYTVVLAAQAVTDLLLYSLQPTLSSLGEFIIRPLFLLLVAAALWYMAPRIGRALSPEDHPPAAPSQIQARTLAEVGYGMVALALLVPAGGGLVQYAVLASAAPYPYPSNLNVIALLWNCVAQCVLAMVIFVGRKGLAGLFGAFRNF